MKIFFEKLKDFGEKFGNVLLILGVVNAIGLFGYCIYNHFQKKEDRRLLQEFVDECVQSGDIIFERGYKPMGLKGFNIEEFYFYHLRDTDSLKYVKSREFQDFRGKRMWDLKLFCLSSQGKKDFAQNFLKSREDNE